MTTPDDLHNPGGKVRIKLPDGVIGGARFSECGRYRQALTREWTQAGTAPRAVLFVGMNPSVAAADVSDPTCHRELMFAQDWGFTRYLKGNVLDWRATSPKDIPHDPDEACSAENIPVLQDMAGEAELIIMAYGKLHKRHHGVLERVINAMVESGKPLQCLGLNKDGSAKHPLYLRKDTRPIHYPVPRNL
ncbi:MAG: DUF1643 domain-containing protein [Pseudomonadota bacterium]